jgi:hypothetical protein
MVVRLALVLVFWIMTLITLIAGVVILLGVGWLAVAVPVLVLVAIIGGAVALWRRWRGTPELSEIAPGRGPRQRDG